MKHFVLLSAICVQKPLLEFQRAKLKFEEELQQVGKPAASNHAILPRPNTISLATHR